MTLVVREPDRGQAFAALRSPMEQAFTRVYEGRQWGDDSGVGSVSPSVARYAEFLKDFIEQECPKRVLDVGCGYFDPYVDVYPDSVQYLGIDVVKAVVQRNRLRHLSQKRYFFHTDARNFLHKSADLVIVKDVLQHWCNEDVGAFLKSLETYPAVLFVNTTNHVRSNADCPTGGYRPLDVTRPPFGVPGDEVFCFYVEENTEEDFKTAHLWEPRKKVWHRS